MQITQGDDAPQMQVEERAIVRHWSKDNGERQIQPPLTGPNVTDVTGPFQVGFLNDEILLQQIRCDVKG